MPTRTAGGLTGLATGAGLFLATLPAAAATIFVEDFDAENGGASQLNYSGFAQFTVARTAVDLIASGGFGITCAGGAGACVDLDGSNSQAGLIESIGIGLVAGTAYELRFDVSGNQRTGATDSMLYGITGGQFAGGPITKAGGDPFETIVAGFTATATGTFSIFFDHAGGDNIGLILDNVSLASIDGTTPVPLPASLPLLALGLGAIGLARRRI